MDNQYHAHCFKNMRQYKKPSCNILLILSQTYLIRKTMKLKFKVKEYLITGKLYHRIHISTNQSKMLGLQQGDELIVELLEHKRPDFKAVQHKQIPLTEIIA